MSARVQPGEVFPPVILSFPRAQPLHRVMPRPGVVGPFSTGPRAISPHSLWGNGPFGEPILRRRTRHLKDAGHGPRTLRNGRAGFLAPERRPIVSQTWHRPRSLLHATGASALPLSKAEHVRRGLFSPQLRARCRQNEKGWQRYIERDFENQAFLSRAAGHPGRLQHLAPNDAPPARHRPDAWKAASARVDGRPAGSIHTPCGGNAKSRPLPALFPG